MCLDVVAAVLGVDVDVAIVVRIGRRVEAPSVVDRKIMVSVLGYRHANEADK